MHHYFNPITNKRGDALTGYYVRLTNGSGATVPLYADASATPIVSVSGIADMAKVDADGNVDFYVALGTYSLNIYATDGTTLVKTIQNVPMNVDIDAIYGDATQPAASRSVLAAIAPSAGMSRHLTEAGREGLFVFDSSNLAARVSADTAQGVYVAPASDTTGASGAWVRKFDGFLRPEWFGAKGDGATDDHAAFRSLTGVAALFGYLHVELTGGKTYRVGKQTLNANDVNGAGPFRYANENPLDAIGLSSVIIRGNGATLKFNNALKYGSFSDATTPFNNTSASTINANNAHVGFMLYAKGCGRVHIENVNFDGNSANLTLGGYTYSSGGSDPGFECRHASVKIDSFYKCTLKNCTATNFLLDGYYVSHETWGIADTDAPRPLVVENCTADYIGRNSFGLYSGKGIKFVNCYFLHPGYAPITGGAYRGTLPKAAVDIEAEGGHVIRDAIFENCTLEQGPGGACAISNDLGDSRDVTFRRGRIVGTNIVKKPGFKFDSTKIYGLFASLCGGQTNAADNAVFDGCYITDQTIGDTPLQTNAATQVIGTGVTTAGVMFRRCTFDLSRLKFSITGAVTRDCEILAKWNTSVFAAGATVINLNAGDDHDKLQITDAITANFPGTPYLVSVNPAAVVRRSNLTSATPYLQWLSTTSAGYAGAYDNASGTVIGTSTDSAASGAVTLFPRVSSRNQVFNAAFTANRTLNLNTTGAKAGDVFRITRTAASTGAFNLNVGTGPLKALATGQWCEVAYDGSAWVLAAYGTL